jgi:DNA primase
VFGIDALKAHKEIILCESLIDAWTFWCAGYRNVTASYGIEGFTDDHREAFQKYGITHVLIAYDRDDADEKASSYLAAEMMFQGIECFRVQLPRGMDANEYALQVQPADKSLGIAIRNATWLGKGKSLVITSVGAVSSSLPEKEKAAKRVKNDSESRVTNNPPPYAVEAERPAINTDPMIEMEKQRIGYFIKHWAEPSTSWPRRLDVC